MDICNLDSVATDKTGSYMYSSTSFYNMNYEYVL